MQLATVSNSQSDFFCLEQRNELQDMISLLKHVSQFMNHILQLKFFLNHGIMTLTSSRQAYDGRLHRTLARGEGR
jgi:hypothetical protein